MSQPVISKALVASSVVFAVLLAACGGTSERERGTGPTTPELEAEDHGGKAADCSADDELDFDWIEDFETGAATGWYTNTDVCDKCNDAKTAISDLSKPLSCLGAYADKPLGNKDKDGNPKDCGPIDVVNYYYDKQLVLPDDEAELEELGTKLRKRLQAESNAAHEAFVSCGQQQCLQSQTPSLFDKPLPAEEIVGGSRCKSRYALHVTTAFLRDFGGTVGRQFSVVEPLDVRKWDGIAFWARRGPGGRNLLKVALPETHTDEHWLVKVKGEPMKQPVCAYHSVEDDTTQACDKFGAWFRLADDWQLYTIPFSEMRQAGYGKVAPFFDLEHVLGLSFEYQQGEWDIWLDDVGFYRRK